MVRSVNLDNYLKWIALEVMRRGPDRVVISEEGEMVHWKVARDNHGIFPDVVFIRNDGWTLGAPAPLEDVARKLWEHDWLGLIRKPSATPERV